MDAEIPLNPRAARGMQRKVRIALLVLSAVGTLAVVAGMEAVDVSERTIEYQHALEHSSEQRAQIRRVASMVWEAETSQRGYLLTGDAAYMDRFEEGDAFRAARRPARHDARELDPARPGAKVG